jgi:hypothetical protein
MMNETARDTLRNVWLVTTDDGVLHHVESVATGQGDEAWRARLSIISHPNRVLHVGPFIPKDAGMTPGFVKDTIEEWWQTAKLRD